MPFRKKSASHSVVLNQYKFCENYGIMEFKHPVILCKIFSFVKVNC